LYLKKRMLTKTLSKRKGFFGIRPLNAWNIWILLNYWLSASLSNELILMPNINKFYNLLMHKENQTFQVNCLKYNTGTLFSKWQNFTLIKLERAFNNWTIERRQLLRLDYTKIILMKENKVLTASSFEVHPAKLSSH